jgi:hypothetical protein
MNQKTNDQSNLVIKECATDTELESLYNFNINAFADMQDFEWTVSELKNQISEGWSVLSVALDQDVVAAVFLRINGDSLITKNTSIKIDYQGNGFSHMIKEFYEEYARNNKINHIINYCAEDNFRMISLNEGHNYVKTGNVLESNNHILEWEKHI